MNENKHKREKAISEDVNTTTRMQKQLLQYSQLL